MTRLKFNNHAGYSVSNDEHVLLVDPWLEGAAFFEGWSLLDDSTSNAALIDELGRMGKPVTIWYSHEHSDHFSISFLKELKQAALPSVRIAYQRTMDRRVATHLRKMGWDVVELEPGEVLDLGGTISLQVWPFFDTGDSFSLVIADGVSVLNLNDCAVDAEWKCAHVAARVARHAPTIDVLLTQFGYANWVGNEGDVALRKEAAQEKLRRVALQVERLRPKAIVPFASFVRFCHEENAYLNAEQNTVDDLVESREASPFRDRIHVMKPGDVWEPLGDMSTEASSSARAAAVAHWRALARAEPAAPLRQRHRSSLEDLRLAAEGYRSGIDRNLVWTNHWMERLGVIKPVTIRVTDLDTTVQMSYRRGLQRADAPTAHLECTSEVLGFMFKNDFGFNTTLVNGRFRTADMSAYSRVWRFFILQDLKKMGLGASTPWTTLRVIARNVRKFFVRQVS